MPGVRDALRAPEVEIDRVALVLDEEGGDEETVCGSGGGGVRGSAEGEMGRMSDSLQIFIARPMRRSENLECVCECVYA